MKLTQDTTIGWIGTGVMGAAMVDRLQEAEYSCVVYNRTKEKADAAIQRGATWADSPKAVAEQADVIFTIVGFPQDVREVYLGEDGVLAGASEGSILVDMTTTEPSLAQEIYEAGQKKNVSTVDAPVSGGDVGAKNGKLSIMVGGDEDAVTTVMPFSRSWERALCIREKPDLVSILKCVIRSRLLVP